jgi:hypothetical protein
LTGFAVFGEGLAGEDDGFAGGRFRGWFSVVCGCIFHAVKVGLGGKAARDAWSAIIATVIAIATVITATAAIATSAVTTATVAVTVTTLEARLVCTGIRALVKALLGLFRTGLYALGTLSEVGFLRLGEDGLNGCVTLVENWGLRGLFYCFVGGGVEGFGRGSCGLGGEGLFGVVDRTPSAAAATASTPAALAFGGYRRGFCGGEFSALVIGFRLIGAEGGLAIEIVFGGLIALRGAEGGGCLRAIVASFTAVTAAFTTAATVATTAIATITVPTLAGGLSFFGGAFGSREGGDAMAAAAVTITIAAFTAVVTAVTVGLEVGGVVDLFHEVGDVKEGVAFEADVHKGGLHAGKDAGDAAVIDGSCEGVLILAFVIDFG